jgi:ABC-type molybdenum transport system ATPase subunit/photorepair protein PhrA
MTAQPMTAQSAPAIRVQGLEKSYKKLRALRGVDFDVARGSIFALLGSNGAGKTTVVQTLAFQALHIGRTDLTRLSRPPDCQLLLDSQSKISVASFTVA